MYFFFFARINYSMQTKFFRCKWSATSFECVKSWTVVDSDSVPVILNCVQTSIQISLKWTVQSKIVEGMAKNEMSTAADRSRARKFGVGMPQSSIRSFKQQNDAQNIQWNKDVLYLTSSPLKGFYTWLSSPQTLHPTRKIEKTVAVIAPTSHIL